ncbi:hypothetical protein BDZ91DRAFT_369016 [Kalaharituber pfeilii]|nr:hypothetical protein BDZ91DRAFT_369016 [Kalaharituber pfeilii]
MYTSFLEHADISKANNLEHIHVRVLYLDPPLTHVHALKVNHYNLSRAPSVSQVSTPQDIPDNPPGDSNSSLSYWENNLKRETSYCR